jgi:hypothetical protein
MKLIEEASTWPNGRYDDCLMAQWFLEFHLPSMTVKPRDQWPREQRPSWMGQLAGIERVALGAVG